MLRSLAEEKKAAHFSQQSEFATSASEIINISPNIAY